jgi:hypothetical protein
LKWIVPHTPNAKSLHFAALFDHGCAIPAIRRLDDKAGLSCC